MVILLSWHPDCTAASCSINLARGLTIVLWLRASKHEALDVGAAQQEVAFAKSKSMVGQTLDVLIDRPAGRDVEDGFVGRHQGQAPDIDSVVFVHGGQLHPGQLLQVKVTDYQAYDLVAHLPQKKSRSLKVLS